MVYVLLHVHLEKIRLVALLWDLLYKHDIVTLVANSIYIYDYVLNFCFVSVTTLRKCTRRVLSYSIVTIKRKGHFRVFFGTKYVLNLIYNVLKTY